MATGGISLRRLLLAAILLSLAIRLQEVMAESRGEISEGDKGGKSGEDGEGGEDGKGGKSGEDGEGGEGGKSGEDGEGGEGSKGGKGGKGSKGAKGAKAGKGGEARSRKSPRLESNKNETEEGNMNEHDDTEDDKMGNNNTTSVKLECPKECAEWKLEVLALCGNELKGFDNLCYFFQHKCNNPTAGCHFYCCLYPGTDIATASKFDCDDMCRF